MDGYIKKEDLKKALIARGFDPVIVDATLESIAQANVIEVPTKNDIDKAKDWLDVVLKCESYIVAAKKELAYWKQHESDTHAYMRIRYLEEKIANMINQKLRAAKLIDQVDDYIGRTILTRRYIMGEKWDDIALALGGMTVRNVRIIYDKTLVEFVRLLEEDKKNETLG